MVFSAHIKRTLSVGIFSSMFAALFAMFLAAPKSLFAYRHLRGVVSMQKYNISVRVLHWVVGLLCSTIHMLQFGTSG